MSSAFKPILVLSLYMLSVSACFAGPDATANRFMKDSASMMDWGILRTEQFLIRQDGVGPVSVSYDWEKNRIVIAQWNTLSLPIDEAEARCRAWIGSVRLAAGVMADTGKSFFDISFLASKFGHSGYVRKIDGQEEEDALKELDKMFFIDWTNYDQKEARQTIRCTGDLLSTSIAIER